MKKSVVLSAALLGIALVLFVVVLALGGGTVLYEASNDAFSDEHKDSGTVRVMTTEEAETILPIMADIIAQNSAVVIEIDLKDFEYSGRELSSYENLVNRLKANNAKINLGNTDIDDFRESADNLNIALDVLNADVARLEALKQEIIENAGDTNALFALYSEVQILSREISLTAETYAETAEIMIEIAKGYDLDTSQLVWAIDTVNKIAEGSIRDVGSITPGSSGSANLQIIFTLSDDTVAYGDTLVIDGSSRLSGTHEIYLDNSVWGSFELTTSGAFTKSFKIGQITDGLHIVSIRCDGKVSKLAYFTVVSTPTEIQIASTKVNGNTVTVLGVLQTVNALKVSGAAVEVYADGIGIIGSATTNENGVFSVQTELEDGEYQVYAEFSDKTFPLDPSVSEPVTVKIASPLIFVLLGLAVLGVAGFGLVRFFKRQKSIPMVKEGADSAEFISSSHSSPAKTIAKAVKKFIGGTLKQEDTDKLRVLYHETIRVLATYENINNTKAKTPREILCEVKRQTEDVKVFMAEYEYLHYANIAVSESDLERMKAVSQRIVEVYHEKTE